MFKSLVIFTLILIVFILVFPKVAIKIVYAINGIYRNLTSAFFNGDKNNFQENGKIIKTEAVNINKNQSHDTWLWLGPLLGGLGALFVIIFARIFILGLIPIFGWLVPLCLFGLILLFKPKYN